MDSSRLRCYRSLAPAHDHELFYILDAITSSTLIIQQHFPLSPPVLIANPAIVTATVSASSSSSATVAPLPFLQNNLSKTGCFYRRRYHRRHLIVLIVIVWIRSSIAASSPGKHSTLVWNLPASTESEMTTTGAMEKLTRWNSTNQCFTYPNDRSCWLRDGFGQGGYPVPSLSLPSPAHSADGHGQPPVYHGQRSQGPGYKQRIQICFGAIS